MQKRLNFKKKAVEQECSVRNNVDKRRFADVVKGSEDKGAEWKEA